MNNFSENLKKIRKDNNLSQEQLAEELGVSRQAISKWESGTAYPEMDKIISICNKFNLNIDDLLNNDIREIKGEEQTKNSLNNHIESFLNFITDSINLFSSMNFKSKIKCLFEQAILIIVLICLFCIIGELFDNVLYSILQSLPAKIYSPISDTISSLYIILAIIVSIIIWVHIFKTRYLDYYEKIKEASQKEVINGETYKNIVNFKENENKIIIRDPKHSEYRFIKGLFKTAVLIFKVFISFITLFLCLILVSIFALVVLSYLIFKSSIFSGVLISLISLGILTLILVLSLFNFIFNRKSNKKKMIWSFIISLIILGIGIGLTLIGSLKLNVIEPPESEITTTETYKVEMKKGLFLDNYDINYIEKDIKNIEIEYVINKGYKAEYNDHLEEGSYLYAYCSNPIELIRKFSKGLNENKVFLIEDTIYKINVYASKQNIEALKNNYNEYHKKIEAKYLYEE